MTDPWNFFLWNLKSTRDMGKSTVKIRQIIHIFYRYVIEKNTRKVWGKFGFRIPNTYIGTVYSDDKDDWVHCWLRLTVGLIGATFIYIEAIYRGLNGFHGMNEIIGFTHFTGLSILKKKIRKYRFPLAPLNLPKFLSKLAKISVETCKNFCRNLSKFLNLI